MKKKNIFASLAVAFFCSSAAWGTTLSATECYSSLITLPDDTAKVEVGSITTQVVTEPVTAVSDSLNSAMQPQKKMFTDNDSIAPAEGAVGSGNSIENVNSNSPTNSNLSKDSVAVSILDLAGFPVVNAMLSVYALPDTLNVNSVHYSNLDGIFNLKLAPGNYLLRPTYLNKRLEDITLTIESGKKVELEPIYLNNIKHLKQTEEISTKTRDSYIALYKKQVGQSRRAKDYSDIYEHWKKAFCGNNNRYLVQYLDGITILNASIAYNMEQKNYDRVEQLGDELMELYELAVINIDSLNKQLKEGSDTLTVAKLRAQQLELYQENWKNKKRIQSPNDEPNLNDFYADSLINVEIYNMIMPILASQEFDAEMKDLYNISLILRFKTQDEINRYNGDRRIAREFIYSDLETLDKRNQETFARLESLAQKDSVTMKDNDKVYNKDITSYILDIRQWLIADIGEYVENYREKLANALMQTGNQAESYAKVINEILADKQIINSKDLEAQLLYLEAASYSYANLAKTREMYSKIADLELQLSESSDPALSDEEKNKYLRNSGNRLRNILKTYDKELSSVEKAVLNLQVSEYYAKMAVIEPERAESYHLKLSKQYIAKAETFGYPVELVPKVLNVYNLIKPKLGEKTKESYLLASYAYIKLSDALDKVNSWNKNTEISRKYKFTDSAKLQELIDALSDANYKLIDYDTMFLQFGNLKTKSYKSKKITEKQFDVDVPGVGKVKTQLLHH